MRKMFKFAKKKVWDGEALGSFEAMPQKTELAEELSMKQANELSMKQAEELTAELIPKSDQT